MEMLINGRTVMIRDAIFHNHATGKPVFFLYKLKSVVYNALLSAGKFPLMVDYIYNTGCLEKKFTQEILNKILSFWCTRLIFTRAHRKVGRSVW